MDADALLGAHGELLGRLLPGDAPTELTVCEGQFHYVVIGSERVVRLARTDAAAARLPSRVAVLRVLSGLDLGVRVPEPLAVAGPDDVVPYVVLTRVPGAPLVEGTVSGPEVAEVVARQCHALLSRLFAAGGDQAIRESIPPAPADRWRQFADGVRAELYPLMHASGRTRAERELTALEALPQLSSAVVHGDLGGANLLWDNVDGLPALRGVVDWDDVCLGDPAEDFAAVGAYGPEVLRRVLAHTDGPTGDLVARIAAIQGTFALQQALAAYRDGDDEELADGLTGYR
ncbi:aminoglycoside phosphotransferase family protein [Nocardia iowensis]|uniref:Aminoglycoside phosphotransferase family protein n=1 Tax=Nocardia iowensis TaxID=204891 RepID=A0ABX8S2M1_NOCIO|nr:aminoglycoside phosphotransferase family protein [Nocardia iowensis]